MTHDDHYRSMQQKIKPLTDRIRGMEAGLVTGIYVYGRPGIGKTHTIREFLKSRGINAHYESGGYTPKGLFRVIQEHNDQIIILDDVATVFRNPKSKELLLAALGNQPDGRVITYRTDRRPESVRFTGGIIIISNLPPERHEDELLDALNDRVCIFDYDLTDEEVIALLHHLADQGHESLSREECHEVLEFLAAECQARNIRPSVRLYRDKALQDYLLRKSGLSECDWKDLIRSDLAQHLILLAYPTFDLSKADELRLDVMIVGEIVSRYSRRQEQLDAWESRTGKSRASFDRRLKEWKNATKPRLVA